MMHVLAILLLPLLIAFWFVARSLGLLFAAILLRVFRVKRPRNRRGVRWTK
jgi:hypothetical protein